MPDIIKTFNHQLLNLAKTLSKRFPNNKNLSLFLTGVNTIKSSNRKKLIELFTLHVYQYRSIIMKKDESFFLTRDYIEEKKKFIKKNATVEDNVDDSKLLDIIGNLKNCWSDLNSKEHESIWQYLRVLMILCDRKISEVMNTTK
tara:strand:+ start:675 stop:1106 length:432 start_codon:yes stop_codon:yes gene_type:complete